MNINGTSGIVYGLINNLNRETAASNQSVQRLSTGLRINSAADSPADMLRISRFEAQMRGNQVAQRNIQDGVSLLQTMDQSLSSMQGIGQKIRELAVQYNSDTITSDDKALIKMQAKELYAEFGKIASSTTFGGQNVFDKSSYTIQTGPNSKDNYTIDTPDFFKTATIDTTQSTQVESKQYSFSIAGQCTTGTFTLNLDPNAKDNKFTVKDGCNTYNGSLKFTGDKTGTWSLDMGGTTVTGTLSLNSSSSKTNLCGANTFKTDPQFGGGTSIVSFNLISTQSNTVTSTKKVSLDDMDFDSNADTMLSTDFIDKNVLDPLAKARSSVGVDQEILIKRLDFQSNSENLNTSELSQIRDVDTAKETMELAKQQMLSQTNVWLIQQIKDSQKSYIMGLLQ